jgi:citronellyl-CoA dehydrogenase
MQRFQEERLWSGGRAPRQGADNREVIAYTREGEAFGRPLLDNQVVHFRLAELMTARRCARSSTAPPP